jgi:hypothetical protein
MRSILSVTIAASLLTIPPIRAQTFGESIDLAELKCSELSRVYLAQFVVIDAWLSGYYHGKSGRTVIDRKLAAENTRSGRSCSSQGQPKCYCHESL